MMRVRIVPVVTTTAFAAALVVACGGAMRSSSDRESDDGVNDASASSDRRDAASTVVADAAEAAADAPLPPPDLSAVPELAACLVSTRAIHVTRSDVDGGTETSYDVGPSTANWIGRSDFGGKAVWVSVAVAEGWMIRMNDAVPLTIGRYDTRTPTPAIFVAANAMTFRCGAPTGSFTIVDLAQAATDSAGLYRLAMWFDVTCSDGGHARGCVRYAR